MQLTTDRVPGPYASGGGSARREPNLRFLKGRAGGGAPAGGSAPWSARARVLCVMLHRPRSTGRVSRPPPGTGGPEGAADAAGAQDTVSDIVGVARPRPSPGLELSPTLRFSCFRLCCGCGAGRRATAGGAVQAGGHIVVGSWTAWDLRLQTSSGRGAIAPCCAG